MLLAPSWQPGDDEHTIARVAGINTNVAGRARVARVR
jgi:hypothetical protein